MTSLNGWRLQLAGYAGSHGHAAAIHRSLQRARKYNDSKKNIIILAVIAGVTKIFTSYATMVVAALMAGTALQPALVAAFLSLLATVINSCSTSLCAPILSTFCLEDIARTRHGGGALKGFGKEAFLIAEKLVSDFGWQGIRQNQIQADRALALGFTSRTML